MSFLAGLTRRCVADWRVDGGYPTHCEKNARFASGACSIVPEWQSKLPMALNRDVLDFGRTRLPARNKERVSSVLTQPAAL